MSSKTSQKSEGARHPMNTTEKKRVLFVITKGTWGGAQRYVYDLATNLPRASFEPIVAFGSRGKLAEDLERADIETCEIPALGRDVTFVSDLKSFLQIFVLIKELNPDVVHVNSSKAAGIGALAARMAGVRRIVFTVHGWPFKERRNVLARALIYVASWCTSILSSHVIVVSSVDEREGKRMPLVGRRVRFVPIATATVQCVERERAWEMLRSLTTIPHDDALRIVTIAELTPNKGLRFGIDAVDGLLQRGVLSTYVIISDGEEFGRLKQYAGESGARGRVCFTGFVPDASRYLKAFDIFLLPSIKEGMPYVLLEAAEAGLPIVTTDAIDPSFAELYEAIRIVPSQNPSALTEAIIGMRGKSGRLTENATLGGMVRSTASLY